LHVQIIVCGAGMETAWQASRAAHTESHAITRLRHPYSPRVERRASNGRTLVSRRLGGRAYWAIFKN